MGLYVFAHPSVSTSDQSKHSFFLVSSKHFSHKQLQPIAEFFRGCRNCSYLPHSRPTGPNRHKARLCLMTAFNVHAWSRREVEVIMFISLTSSGHLWNIMLFIRGISWSSGEMDRCSSSSLHRPFAEQRQAGLAW